MRAISCPILTPSLFEHKQGLHQYELINECAASKERDVPENNEKHKILIEVWSERKSCTISSAICILTFLGLYVAVVCPLF